MIDKLAEEIRHIKVYMQYDFFLIDLYGFPRDSYLYIFSTKCMLSIIITFWEVDHVCRSHMSNMYYGLGMAHCNHTNENFVKTYGEYLYTPIGGPVEERCK